MLLREFNLVGRLHNDENCWFLRGFVMTSTIRNLCAEMGQLDKLAVSAAI
jgi:hypothetical protein